MFITSKLYLDIKIPLSPVERGIFFSLVRFLLRMRARIFPFFHSAGLNPALLRQLFRHLMPAYVLSIVSGYNPDVYFCSVCESSGSRLFFFYFRRLTIGSHVVHCPACHAVINYVPFKEHKLLFILLFCRIFAATLPPAGSYLWCRPAKPVSFNV